MSDLNVPNPILNPEGRDEWIPACGGTETEFTVNGIRLLYCLNPARSLHRYLNLGTDMIIKDDEYFALVRAGR